MKISFDHLPLNCYSGQLVELKKGADQQIYLHLGEDSYSGGQWPDVLGLDRYRGIVSNPVEPEISVIRYAPLHCHSDNSLQDGMAKIPELAKQLEYSAAITDHGNLYGFLDFYQYMRAVGKHPILGFEAYCEDINGVKAGNHLILLAKNNTGLHNLMHLTSESFQNQYRSRPHVSWEMLEKYSEGVIASSACINGLLGSYLRKGELDHAKVALERYVAIFGENFYVELQRHGIDEETRIEPMLLKLAREYNVSVIATTDSHYLNINDAKAHEVLLCLQFGKTMDDDSRMRFDGSGYHVLSSEEMENLFYDLPEALDNTLRIAGQCCVDLELNAMNLPTYDVPESFVRIEDFFDHLCNRGFQSRFAGSWKLTSAEYQDRFSYEINLIKQMGFTSYFIIVWDYINFARQKNIYVGPGRGSAAGSLVAYCLGITDLDPIAYGLLFERFINPERVSWPDIDTDFEDLRRVEVIEYVRHKYGVESVCGIISFGIRKAKMAIRDVARAMGFAAAVGSKLSKMIPDELNMTIAKALDKNPEFMDQYNRDERIREVIDIAKQLEGCKRHASQHACGIVIAPDHVQQFLPTSIEANENNKEEKSVTSQVPMKQVEQLGLLKMDLLGLKNMTVIHQVIDMIKHTRGIDLKYQDIPLDDRETYRMLSKGITGGVFQLEGAGMTKVVREMLDDIDSIPDSELKQCFERMIAAVSLYRPGPMAYIPSYIEGMKSPESVQYDTPLLEPILKSTYGEIVYQEQVMQIVQSLAGYTLGRADLIRRAMGKKERDTMDHEKDVFIYGDEHEGVAGCVKNGVSKEAAERIWTKMHSFAAYAFNKSHAACYAFIAVITAYMSCHFPHEFYCAMFNVFGGDKFKTYLVQAVRRGINILPPDINQSEVDFALSEDGIRFGLKGITGLDKLAYEIVDERTMGGPYSGFKNLYDRMGLRDKKLGSDAIKSLIFSGAFDLWGYTKHSLVEAVEPIKKRFDSEGKIMMSGQVSFLDLGCDEVFAFEIKPFPEYTHEYLMAQEYEVLGFYLTGHPVDDIRQRLSDKDYTYLDQLVVCEETISEIRTIGMIRDMKTIYTKKGDAMSIFTLEDRFNEISCVVFPKRLAPNQHLIEKGQVVIVCGRYEPAAEYDQQIQITHLLLPGSQSLQCADELTIAVKDRAECRRLIEFIKRNPGETKVNVIHQDQTYSLNYSIKVSPGIIDQLQQTYYLVNSA